MDTNSQPVISHGQRGKCRQHSPEFKRVLVELSQQPDISVARLAREHGVNANQVFSWRRLYESGQLAVGRAATESSLVQVIVTSERGASAQFALWSEQRNHIYALSP